MTRITTVKTNFTGGEICRRLLARGDLRAYENGAMALRNVLVQPTGGVTRRPGTLYLGAVRGPARLAAFTFSTEQAHLLIFADKRVEVWTGGEKTAELAAPWSADQLPQLTWTQSADVMLICHPEIRPRRLLRTATAWWLEPLRFAVEEGPTGDPLVRIPFHRFADDGVTLTPDGTEGRVRVTASAPVFHPRQEWEALRIRRRQGRIIAVRSPTEALVELLEPLPDRDPTIDWDEPAFSHTRGWPVSACFHQDRLVIGGSRDLPNRLWLSRSGDLFNFDLGEGLDDEAIEFAILSDQVNPIRAVASGRHLQVFTTGAEWAVTGEPLTPTAIRLDRQTRIGSRGDRQVPMRAVDGATVFCGGAGELREFVWTDLERSYRAGDLGLLSSHIVQAPVDLDWDPKRRVLLAVMADGRVGALAIERGEQVSAWSRIETAGRVESLAVLGEPDGAEVYWLVERDGARLLEVWDERVALDCALTGTAATPTSRWAGLDHLTGRRVGLLADGAVLPDQTVEAGKLRLPRPAASLAAGLRFEHRVEPLPANLLSPEGQGQGRGRRARPMAVTFRTIDCAALTADLGRGPVAVPLRRVAPGALAEDPAPPGTADRTLGTLGWPADPTRPLWCVRDDQPLPFTLLSATLTLKVND